RNEIEPERLGGGTRCQANIGLSGKDTISRGEMTVGDPIVPLNLLSFEAGLRQKLIQKCAASRPWLAVHETNVLAAQIVDLMNPFRITRPDDQPLFPTRKRDNSEIFVRKLLPNVGQIELTGLRVFQMRTRDMYLAFL